MVNNCGHWTYEPYTPTNKKCWLDYIADWITSTGYKVETTIENVAIMVTSHWELEMEDREEQEDTTPSELPEIPVATREQSGLLCFHSR